MQAVFILLLDNSQLLSLVTQYAHHVVMDAFLNANKLEKLVWGSRMREENEQDVVIISFGIPLSQIYVSKVLHLKSVHYDVVGILVVVTSESSWEYVLFCIFRAENRPPRTSNGEAEMITYLLVLSR